MTRGRNLAGFSSAVSGEFSDINITGIVTAASFVGDGSALTNVGGGAVGPNDSINTTGIITASSFVGSGSGLTGLGTFSGNYNDLSNQPTIPSNVSDLTNDSGFITNNTSGTVTATAFVGDGSGLTSVIGSGSGVVVKDGGSTVGTAGTIDFGANLSVSPISVGVVTVTAAAGSGSTANVSTNTLVVAGVSTLASVTVTSISGDGSGLTGLSTFSGNYSDLSGTPTIPTNNNQLANGAGYITSAGAGVTATGDGSYIVKGRWTLGANGSSDYTFTGIGFTQTTNDPDIYLERGSVYEFVNGMGAHGFQIQETTNGTVGNPYNNGVTNNGTSNGTVKFEVPFNAPDTLYYQCTTHTAMGGPLHIYPLIR